MLVHFAQEHQPAANQIDLARNAPARAVQFSKETVFETGIAVPADMLQPMDEVRLDFAFLHRLEMMGGDHALAQLFQACMTLQGFAELRLAQQEGLQQRMVAQLEIGQHPQFFECTDLEVLGLVDDQKAAAPGPGLFMQEVLDFAQSAGLVVPFDRQAEALGDDMDDFFRSQLAGHNLSDSELLRIHGGHQVGDERGLACTHLARDDHEPFALC